MKLNISQIKRMAFLGATLFLLSVNVNAQSAQQRLNADDAGGGWWLYIIVGLLCLALAFLAWRKLNPAKVAADILINNNTGYYSNIDGSYDMEGLDVDKDLEWLRKRRTSRTKQSKAPGEAAIGMQSRVAFRRATGDIDTKAFQEKMRKLQYVQLPINSFTGLRPTKTYEELPESYDPSLLAAIEQANEEYEEDDAVREVALKVLAAFKTQTSVESLTQIALYDLSSNLRSKAVSALTEFDHATVFEPILLACADPTREVRASAARGLFRLGFDRADAWNRIGSSGDEFRMRHAARAAVESGIAAKSFDRLVHEDLKVASEAFALVAFLISAGETDEIYRAIKQNKDERIKFALLHVLKMHKDERTPKKLVDLKRSSSFSDDVVERINDTIASFENVFV